MIDLFNEGISLFPLFSLVFFFSFFRFPFFYYCSCLCLMPFFLGVGYRAACGSREERIFFFTVASFYISVIVFSFFFSLRLTSFASLCVCVFSIPDFILSLYPVCTSFSIFSFFFSCLFLLLLFFYLVFSCFCFFHDWKLTFFLCRL